MTMPARRALKFCAKRRAALLMHVIAAKAIAFGEALQPSFKNYINQVLLNAKTLADGLLNRVKV